MPIQIEECLLREKNMILHLENHIFFPKPGEHHTSYIHSTICPLYNLIENQIISLVIQIFPKHRKDI